MDRIVHSVEVSTIVHATENPERAEVALNAVLPASMKKFFTRKYLHGHHGNPIIMVSAKLERSVEVRSFLKHFMTNLTRNDALRITKDLDLFSDAEGNLYIRLDKQACFQGIMKLTEEDPIRVKIKFDRLRGEPAELMKTFLESEQSD